MLSHLELIHKAYYIRDIAIFCGNADYINFLATVTIGIKCLKTSDLGWRGVHLARSTPWFNLQHWGRATDLFILPF